MEILERKDNPLLNRWRSNSQESPRRGYPNSKDMVIAAAKSSQMRTRINFIKDVRTVFGKGRTEGYALIYADKASASIEPDYVSDRHKGLFEEPNEGDGE